MLVFTANKCIAWQIKPIHFFFEIFWNITEKCIALQYWQYKYCTTLGPWWFFREAVFQKIRQYSYHFSGVPSEVGGLMLALSRRWITRLYLTPWLETNWFDLLTKGRDLLQRGGGGPFVRRRRRPLSSGGAHRIPTLAASQASKA